jgi:hypothetical protein
MSIPPFADCNHIDEFANGERVHDSQREAQNGTYKLMDGSEQ